MFYLMLRMLADDLASRLLSRTEYERCVEKVTTLFCEQRESAHSRLRKAPII